MSATALVEPGRAKQALVPCRASVARQARPRTAWGSRRHVRVTHDILKAGDKGFSFRRVHLERPPRALSGFGWRRRRRFRHGQKSETGQAGSPELGKPPSTRMRASRAKVAALQEMETTSGRVEAASARACSIAPARGGSMSAASKTQSVRRAAADDGRDRVFLSQACAGPVSSPRREQARQSRQGQRRHGEDLASTGEPQRELAQPQNRSTIRFVSASARSANSASHASLPRSLAKPPGESSLASALPTRRRAVDARSRSRRDWRRARDRAHRLCA